MMIEEFAIMKDDGDNIYPKPTTAQEGLDILIKHFLGDDWYIADPLPQSQVNTVAVLQILEKTQNKTLWQSIKEILFG